MVWKQTGITIKKFGSCNKLLNNTGNWPSDYVFCDWLFPLIYRSADAKMADIMGNCHLCFVHCVSQFWKKMLFFTRLSRWSLENKVKLNESWQLHMIWLNGNKLLFEYIFNSLDKFARVCRKEGSEAPTRLGTSIVWGAILGFMTWPFTCADISFSLLRNKAAF